MLLSLRSFRLVAAPTTAMNTRTTPTISQFGRLIIDPQRALERRIAAFGGEVAGAFADMVLPVDVGAAATQGGGGVGVASAHGADQGRVALVVRLVDGRALVQQGLDLGGAAARGGGAQLGAEI